MRPPESWQNAKATLAIGGVTAGAWLLTIGGGLEQAAALWAGFIPIRVSGATTGATLVPVVLTPLTATLVHSGLPHLFLNLLAFLFCGRAIETIIGRTSFLILYVAGAYLAAAAQYFAGPLDTTPMIGASGAISAVIGAYAMLFGRNKVKVANPELALWLHALWLAVAWVLLQLLIGLTFVTGGARVAIAAHIGGFLAGLLLAKPLLLLRYRKA
jgi:membrane associated rhomboid family serine protease